MNATERDGRGDASGGAALRHLAEEYGVEWLASVSDDILDPSLVAQLPVEWARANALLPVRVGGKVCVLTDDPSSVSQQEYLSLLLGIELMPVVASREAILKAIEACYYRKKDSTDEFLRGLSPGEGVTAGGEAVRSDDLLQVAEKAPVTQLVNLIVLEAVKRRASDVHFEPFESKLRVRYRIDGVLYETASPPRPLVDALISRLKVMARMDLAERRLPQDGMARVRVGEREVDIRVSTVPVAEGERVVLRLLDKSSTLLPLDVLGMDGAMLGRFGELVKHRSGMIVVSGPTGSGKTTTLYAVLGTLDAARKNIITIEDPIEYQLSDIGQIQVKPKIGLTFAMGLRHVLRQDPDVILVGETRDTETAEIAVRASLTGHQVFTTLHTNDAVGAVVRLVDMEIEPYLLASCLRGVLAQRLVRTLCPACRREHMPDPAEMSRLGPRAAMVAGRSTWEAAACSQCLEGYRGRTGLFELLVMDSDLEAQVARGHAGADVLRRLAAERGMTSLLDDGLQKALRGVTDLAEVLTVAA